MKKIDCLFVHPNAAHLIYQELSNELSAVEPPIWAALLANGLRYKGFEVDILDCEAEKLSVIDASDKINEIAPRLVAIIVYGQQPSASTQNMTGASALCKELKTRYPELKIILVGLHPSALPKLTIEQEPVDFVCQGEGLHTLDALLQSRYTPDLQKVPGLWYREDGIVRNTPPALVIEDLETSLPGIAWDLLPMNKYRTSNWHSFTNNMARTPFASLYTSLGCPFKCTFCCINAPFGKPSFRYWKPEFIIREFDKIAKMGIRNIKIADEMFVLNENHFMRLCELIIERNYDFNIWAYARVDTVKEKYLETLGKAGVKWLALGIESGNKAVRTDVVKGRFEDINIYDIVKKVQGHGIRVMGNFIFGLPEDTLGTMQETLALAIDLQCEMVNFYCAMAYPGSKLYELAIQEKWELPDSWLGYSQHSFETKPLPTRHASAAEVLKFRDDAFHQYFSLPSVLEKTRSIFGQTTHDDIISMTSKRLRRKLTHETN